MIEFKPNPLHDYYEVVQKPTDVELEKYYAEKYYQIELGSYVKHYSDEELRCFRNKIEQKDFVVSGVLNKQSDLNLLDAGCGEGFTLDFYNKRGGTGVDFSDFGSKSNHSHLLLNLEHGYIFEEIYKLLEEEKQFDLVCLDHVLEHVLDPCMLLDQCERLTKSGGVLVIEVPNGYSEYWKVLIEKGHVSRRYWEAYPDHLNYFSCHSLRSLCEAHGYRSIKIISDFPIQNGTYPIQTLIM